MHGLLVMERFDLYTIQLLNPFIIFGDALKSPPGRDG